MTSPLTKAFKELRKKDYLAERSYACCRSCANANIPDEYENLCVFTVDYDEKELKDTNSCYLSWSAPEDNPKEIIKELKKVGIKVKWNNNSNTRLFISLPKSNNA